MARSLATNRSRIANMDWSLKFDGTQRAALTTMGNLGSSFLGALSFGTYIETNTRLTTAMYLFGCSQSAGGNFAFFGITRIAGNVGKLFLSLRDASGRALAVETTSAKVNFARGFHVGFSKDASNTPGGIKIYINGVSQALTTVSNAGYADPVDFNRLAALGSSLGSSAVAAGWVGYSSQSGFYKRELTATEFLDWAKHKIKPLTPFASWPTTEGAGTALADQQGNHNGTLTAAGQWSAHTPYKSRSLRSL